jgi:hypothetical protein
MSLTRATSQYWLESNAPVVLVLVRLLEPSRFRLYRATVTAPSILGPGDERVPLAHGLS